MEKQLSDSFKNAVILLVFIISFFILVSTRKSKEAIAKDYGITRPTLSKWIKFFQNEIPHKKWNEMRWLRYWDTVRLKQALGEEIEFVLSKKEIAKRCESNYKTVSDNVKLNLKKLGITLEAWESCSIFPPSITKKILEMLG